MPHDPARVAECRAWLLRALADLDAAAILLGAAKPRPESAVFHCQQAAEKAWKAFLFWHDVPFRKSHDLRELGQSCVTVDGSLAAIAEEAEQLTPFAWVFRYPGEPRSHPWRRPRRRSRSRNGSTRPSWPACPRRSAREAATLSRARHGISTR